MPLFDRKGATMPSENTPLVPPSNALGDGPTVYFNSSTNPQAINLGVDTIPAGASVGDFNPRPVTVGARGGGAAYASSKTSGGWFGGIFGAKKTNAFAGASALNDTGTMVLPRSAPVKVDPKVFFSNERTFLAWLHVSVILAGASVAIVAFSDSHTTISNQLYGVILLPVSIAFIIYAMMQYSRRAVMIRTKSPGPYVDIAGPTVLTMILMTSIVAQFSIKLYTLM